MKLLGRGVGGIDVYRNVLLLDYLGFGEGHLLMCVEANSARFYIT